MKSLFFAIVLASLPLHWKYGESFSFGVLEIDCPLASVAGHRSVQVFKVGLWGLSGFSSAYMVTAAGDGHPLGFVGYAIFSPRAVGYLLLPEGPIAVGCTVVQRLGVGAIFLESGTRVIEVWDTTDERGSRVTGFAYVTLQGHPERGVATFEVRKDADTVQVVLTARSTPGTGLTRMASPVTRLVQRSITKKAVKLLTDAH